MVSNINMVKLSNGSSVSWDEFSRWSYPKQVRNLNPPNLGKDFGEEFRKKMSTLVKEGHKNNLRKKTRNTGEKNGSSRAVISPKGRFSTIKECASAYSVLPETIRQWIIKKDEFCYADTAKQKASFKRNPSRAASKKVITPYGEFESMVQAAKFENVRVQTLREWVKSPNHPEYKFFTTADT